MARSAAKLILAPDGRLHVCLILGICCDKSLKAVVLILLKKRPRKIIVQKKMAIVKMNEW